MLDLFGKWFRFYDTLYKNNNYKLFSNLVICKLVQVSDAVIDKAIVLFARDSQHHGQFRKCHGMCEQPIKQ